MPFFKDFGRCPKILDYTLLLSPYGPRKAKFWKNVLQMFTINDSHKIHCFSDMECNRQNFVVLDHFFPFYPPNSLKNKNFLKKEKKPRDIITLCTCTKNYVQMTYSSWDRVHDRCNCYFSFWALFPPFTLLKLKKSKFSKNEKKTPGDIIILYVYQKLWSDDVWFLRYGAWRM